MHIKSIRITSYKSFLDSEEVTFSPGVNLVVGVNNAGKTALLEALSLKFTNKPFRGESEPPTGDSSVYTTFRICMSDVRNRGSKEDPIIMPAFDPGGTGVPMVLLSNLLKDELEVQLVSGSSQPFVKVMYPYKDQILEPISNAGVAFRVTGSNHQVSGGEQRGGLNPFVADLVNHQISRYFYFNSERMQLHSSDIRFGFGDLESNASNLAACLLQKQQANEEIFRTRFIGMVKRVLPVIKYVSCEITANDPSKVQLRVWPKEQSESNVSHLLSESGTGIGQVLAMLYVVTYMDSSVIIIDEPNSFLHPGATRELLRIFEENTQHQYFISTHSPEVFSELKPEYYTSLSYADGKTHAKRESFGNLSDTYRDLGISPFFRSSLWVEGESEEAAFPKILGDPHMQVFKISSASEVGNKFNKEKEIDRLIRIHRDMLKARHGEPTPSLMRIIVDGEHIDDAKHAEYKKAPDRIIHFLPRRMFENYLLDSEAIAVIVSEDSKSEVSQALVESHLVEQRGEDKMDDWLKNVDGAKVLRELFPKLTYATCEFQKVQHTTRLTEFLLKNRTGHFEEFRSFVSAVFEVDVTP